MTFRGGKLLPTRKTINQSVVISVEILNNWPLCLDSRKKLVTTVARRVILLKFVWENLLPIVQTQNSQKRHNRINQVEHPESEGDFEVNNIFATVDSITDRGEHVPPISVHVTFDGIPVIMEVGTGASVSLIPEKNFTQLWPGRSLDTTEVIKAKWSYFIWLKLTQ